MVNEEDFTPEVDFFMPQIYEAKAKAAAMGTKKMTANAASVAGRFSGIRVEIKDWSIIV